MDNAFSLTVLSLSRYDCISALHCLHSRSRSSSEVVVLQMACFRRMSEAIKSSPRLLLCEAMSTVLAVANTH